MTSRNEYIREFNKLLEDEWSLFVTVTYRESRGVENAEKSFKHFLKYLNKPLGEDYFYDKKIWCWVFIEQNKARDGVHLHALIKGINPKKAFLLEEKCCEKFGVSKVDPYDPNRGARLYLASKYNKPWLNDFDFCKINSRLRKRKVLRTNGDFWDKTNKKWIPRNQEEHSKQNPD